MLDYVGSLKAREGLAQWCSLAMNKLDFPFEELRAILGKASSKLRLELDANGDDVRGRYFVATQDLTLWHETASKGLPKWVFDGALRTVGEVILSEQPIFQGDREGKNSQKVYVQSFLEKIEASFKSRVHIVHDFNYFRHLTPGRR